MTMQRWIAALVGAAVWAAAACPAPADGPVRHADGLIASPESDWPQWRGRYRDGICDETGLLRSWPKSGPKLLWKVNGLGRGWSSPIIANSTLYITGDVGQELRVFAFTLDGKPQWQVANGRYWRRPHPGARASCAYSDGLLYHMNAHGRVVCLDAGSGREVWTVNILQRFEGRNIRWALSECLLADGPRLIVTPGGRKGLMAALDKKTGATVWRSEAVAGERAGYASPILFKYGGLRHIVNCSSRHVFGVNADTGKLLWRKPRPTRFEVIASVPVYHDGTVFAASPDGKRSELFRLRVDGDHVGAESVWLCDLNDLSGGVIFLDGRLYGAGYRKFDYWMCVDHKTGKTLYAQRDLHRGAGLFADGRLYCLSERGRVALLEPAADGFRQRGRFTLVARTRGDAWAHPVIHNRRLYLRYHDTLWCFDIAAN